MKSRATPKPMVYAAASPLRRIVDTLQRVAKSRVPVLVVGESGTGKEGIVRRIHQLAPWSSGPFVPINCGAIPANLLESELFGHVRGAFTGADRARVGRIEAASGGTLFLDEIGEMPIALQPKLLRVLQEQVYVPLGSSSPRKANFRVVAATNRDLQGAIEQGTFRQDLFFRLDVVRIALPPLRERAMDVALLARHFLGQHAEANASRVVDFTDRALALLADYHWPGNIRELENVIQGILVLKEEGLIDGDDVERKLGPRRSTGRSRDPATSVELPADGLALKETLERLERHLIYEALGRVDGNRSQAANLLGLNRTTLVEKLKRFPSPPSFDPQGSAG